MSHLPHYHHRREDDAGPEVVKPVTSEQLDFFTSQTNRAVEKALRIFSRRAMIGFAILFIATIGNAWYANYASNQASDAARHAVVRSGNVVAVDGCNRDFRDRIGVRGVLIASKDFTLQAVKRQTLPPAEAKERIDFYNQRLRELPLPDCRMADSILTDNPDKSLTQPAPLYPDKSGNGPAGPDTGG